MKTRMSLTVALLFLVTAFGCTEKQRHDISHWKSDLIGLKRTITLYGADGKPIKSWTGRFKVELGGSTARFMEDGKSVIISGTYIIEEQ